jgi:hypothetical protein
MGFIIIIIFIFGNENLKVNEMLLLLKHFKIHPFLECLCLSFHLIANVFSLCA